MRIALRFARPFRVWHARLRARLEADGHKVSLQPMAATSRRTLALALTAERLVYRSRSALFQRVFETGPDADPAAADRVLSLDGAPGVDAALSLLFDDAPGDAAMLNALLAGRAPLLAIRDRHGRVLAAGRPALERPDLLSKSIDHVLAAAIDLFVTAVRTPGLAPPTLRPEAIPRSAGAPLVFVARHLAGKIARRLRRRQRGDVHWRVAMRFLGPRDASIATLRAWPDSALATIADDSPAYHADPFPFEQDGRRFIFLELYPYATRKGVIALIEIDKNGVASAPRVVLEQPGHLSYPFVFEAGGAIYMLPETSDARCLRLFRADPFPDRWVPDKTVVADVVAADATLVFHEGLYWIFASLAGDGGSSWDRLGLFHAPSMLGPWTAHKANPVLVDAGAARPAGAPWHEGGVLMRVAQDCRAGYGAGLAICRVDRLDRDGYAQSIVATLPAPEGAVRAHTLNRSASIEVIDIGIIP